MFKGNWVNQRLPLAAKSYHQYNVQESNDSCSNIKIVEDCIVDIYYSCTIFPLDQILHCSSHNNRQQNHCQSRKYIQSLIPNNNLNFLFVHQWAPFRFPIVDTDSPQRYQIENAEQDPTHKSKAIHSKFYQYWPVGEPEFIIAVNVGA